MKLRQYGRAKCSDFGKKESRPSQCLLAQAQFPPGEKYEALARQMLEKIDYDGLAKLIER